MNKSFFTAANFERMDMLKDRVRSLGDQGMLDMFEPLYLDFMLAYRRGWEGHWVEDPTAGIIVEEYGPFRRKVGGRRRQRWARPFENASTRRSRRFPT